MDADYRKIPMNLMSIHGLWCKLYFLTESATKHINEINGRLSPEIPEARFASEPGGGARLHRAAQGGSRPAANPYNRLAPGCFAARMISATEAATFVILPDRTGGYEAHVHLA
jgi:hypothetical protein